jgi:hypothetical protein
MKRQYNSITIGIIVYLLALLFVPGQQAAAQSASEYELTLGAMGYQDRTVSGPKSSTAYYFSLPAYWEILDGSYITLDLEYKVRLSEGTAYHLSLLEVQFNSQSLHIEELSAPTTRQLRVNLPANQFRLSEEPRANGIEIFFNVDAECEQALRSSMTIKNTSVLHLVYKERPLPIDLNLFPKPIYQRWALEPSHVRFVLPNEFDETDLRAATIIAAQLGQLTSSQLPISATLASEQPAYAIPGEHLIVVGSPDKNPMIGQLEFPMLLAERRLALSSQMPMSVAYGSVLSYTLFVENTTSSAQSLMVEDRFSLASASFLGCEESCKQVTPGKINWDIGSLAAGHKTSTTVTLQVTPVISPDIPIRHTATLFDSQGNILDVDTLSARIGEKPDGGQVTSPQKKSTQFFVQEAQAVPEDAGVIQEIVSPWSARHVAVIVTGLNDEALLKAARGLNPRNHFPGMSEESAIVEDIRPLSSSVAVPSWDITFASLGYENEELNMLDLESKEYVFDFPPGAILGEDSYLALHLAHAAIVSTVGGGIKVTLNDVPVGSAYLDDSNLNSAWLPIPLSRVAIQPGLNRISILSTVNAETRCVVDINNPYWLEIYADSFLHLDYRPTQPTFDLDSFPYPFNRPGDMGNVVFALSDTPSLMEIEGLLRIASLLGGSSGSEEFMPLVTFGEGSLTSLPDSHVIAIGLPTMNSAIHRANDKLPQPFLPNSNDIYQQVDNPIYTIAPGTALGFVQELVSPWDSGGNHAFLVATGTTEEGVHWALSALQFELNGNLAIVRDDKIYSTDTRPVVAEEVFSMTVSITPTLTELPIRVAVETPTPQPVSEQAVIDVTPTKEYVQPIATSSPRPRWLLPLLIVSVLSVIVLVVIWLRNVAR